jgi:hypothetical protein
MSQARRWPPPGASTRCPRRGPLAGVPFLAKEGTTARAPIVERLATAGANPDRHVDPA